MPASAVQPKAKNSARSQKEKERAEWRETYGVDARSIADNDYTSIPQAEWSNKDWRAFMSFSPTQESLSWRHEWKATVKADYSDFQSRSHRYCAPIELIDVSKWSRFDWCYYWYVNSTVAPECDCVPKDGKAWTSKQSSKPYLERERAFWSDDFAKRRREYFAYGDEGQANTPYGKLDIERYGIPEWKHNVGVPFAYALTSDYESWRQWNLDAQNKAKELYKKRGTPVAATLGWTGKDLLTPEQFASARAGKRHSPPGTQRADGKLDPPFYKRGIMLGAPKWYSVMNAIANHFPARLLFWAIALSYIAYTQLSGPSGAERFVMVGFALLCFVNVLIPVLSPIRKILRYSADDALKVWAKMNNMTIDWDKERVSAWEQ